jgi:hypothetical protein
MQDGVEPLGQLLARRHLIRNVRIADLSLGADDALRERRRRNEKGARDFLGFQTAHLAQRQRNAGVGAQRRMAAGENQPEPIVLHGLLVDVLGRHAALDLLGDAGHRRVEPRAAPQPIDRLEAAGRDEPRARIVGKAVLWPAVERRGEGVVHRLLGEIEIAKEADEGREHTARVAAIDRFDRFAHMCGWLFRHRRP